MKWIGPENGGTGYLINLDQFKSIKKTNNQILFRDYNYYSMWEYPDKSSRDADFERIRRIALGIGDQEEKKQSENADPYAVDWSQIQEGYDYVATDRSGSVYGYNIMPSIANDGTYVIVNTNMSPKYKLIGHAIKNPDWQNSLRVRPGKDLMDSKEIINQYLENAYGENISSMSMDRICGFIDFMFIVIPNISDCEFSIMRENIIRIMLDTPDRRFPRSL